MLVFILIQQVIITYYYLRIEKSIPAFFRGPKVPKYIVGPPLLLYISPK